ncbi:hypothetical protein HMPREF3156_00141 [Neisseria sp. HMSC06F02]|nr:hypothetical protein HMPREF3156_00141 [Neisseria sp. HMSC06F02]
MLFSEPPQAFRLSTENTEAVINVVIGFIDFPFLGCQKVV